MSASSSTTIPTAYHLVSKHYNPLLSNLRTLQSHLDILPKEGHHINATFTRDRKVIEECLKRAPRTKELSEETKQMALEEGIIVVYQAYNRTIAKHAQDKQQFIGCPLFNLTRMTWIKSSILWCLHRCEWATRDVNQERMIAITLPIPVFDQILKWTVESSHGPSTSNTTTNEKSAEEGANEEKKKENNNDEEDEKHQKTDEKNSASASSAGTSRKVPSKNDPVRLQWDPDHTELGDKLTRRAIQLGLRGPTLELFHKSIICIDDVTDSIVVPGRPEKFDSNKPWMVNYDPSCTKKKDNNSSSNDDNKNDDDTTKNKNKKDDENEDGDDEAASSKQKEALKLARRQAILLPVEDLYVPRDEAIVKRVRLDTAAAVQQRK